MINNGDLNRLSLLGNLFDFFGLITAGERRHHCQKSFPVNYVEKSRKHVENSLRKRNSNIPMICWESQQ